MDPGIAKSEGFQLLGGVPLNLLLAFGWGPEFGGST